MFQGCRVANTVLVTLGRKGFFSNSFVNVRTEAIDSDFFNIQRYHKDVANVAEINCRLTFMF